MFANKAIRSQHWRGQHIFKKCPTNGCDWNGRESTYRTSHRYTHLEKYKCPVPGCTYKNNAPLLSAHIRKRHKRAGFTIAMAQKCEVVEPATNGEGPVVTIMEVADDETDVDMDDNEGVDDDVIMEDGADVQTQPQDQDQDQSQGQGQGQSHGQSQAQSQAGYQFLGQSQAQDTGAAAPELVAEFYDSLKNFLRTIGNSNNNGYSYGYSNGYSNGNPLSNGGVNKIGIFTGHPTTHGINANGELELTYMDWGSDDEEQ